MRQRLFAVIVVCSCGGTTAGDDAGPDTGIVDAAVDVTVPPDAASDVVIDALGDVGSDVFDASMPKPDAPYVDLDASSSPWGQSFGAGWFNSVAVDTSLNVVAVGTLTSSSYSTYYVQALNKVGVSLWNAKATSNTVDQSHQAVFAAFDSIGNAYVTGYTTDAIDVGGGAKGPGGFVVKYDTAGTFQWEYGPFASTNFLGVRVKSNGNVVLVGYMGGSQDYGGGMVTSNGMRDALLVEITPTAAYVRAKTWGDAGDQMVLALAIDYLDNLVLTGRFESTIDFGGGTLNGPTAGSGSYNTFIAKLDSTAAYMHQKDAKSASNNDNLPTVSCDYLGNIFVAGNVSNTMNLGGSTLSCGGAVVGELDPTLAHLWSECFMYTSGDGVAADPTAGAALSGSYNGNATFGLGTLPASQGLYVARFDSMGTDKANFGSGSTTYSGGTIAFMTWPDFVVAGQCSGSLTLPSGTLTCSGSAFVARLQP